MKSALKQVEDLIGIERHPIAYMDIWNKAGPIRIIKFADQKYECAYCGMKVFDFDIRKGRPLGVCQHIMSAKMTHNQGAWVSIK